MIRDSRFRLATAPVLFILLSQALAVSAAAKTHVVTFGKWTTVQWSPDSVGGTESEKPLTLKVRPLLVDARVKEFTLGATHEITDRLFVVRRSFRFNDSLPQESNAPPHWQWQRGGWLLVDRITGHISPINLPEFDAFYSAASWYRDYAAYCGLSDDGPPQASSEKASPWRQLRNKRRSCGFRLPHPRLATQSLPRELRARRRTQTDLRHSRPHRRPCYRRG